MIQNYQGYHNNRKGRNVEDEFIKKIQSRFLNCKNHTLQKAKFFNNFAVAVVNLVYSPDIKKSLRAELYLKKSNYRTANYTKEFLSRNIEVLKDSISALTQLDAAAAFRTLKIILNNENDPTEEWEFLKDNFITGILVLNPSVYNWQSFISIDDQMNEP